MPIFDFASSLFKYWFNSKSILKRLGTTDSQLSCFRIRSTLGRGKVNRIIEYDTHHIAILSAISPHTNTINPSDNEEYSMRPRGLCGI